MSDDSNYKGGAWHPFGEHRADDADGPVFLATPKFDRIPPRVLNLMIEEVSQFHIQLWPTCDYKDGSFETLNERVEVVAFSADAYHSSIDLGEWLRAGFAGFDHTGDEAEIASLEKLKAVCDELIEARRKRIASRPVI